MSELASKITQIKKSGPSFEAVILIGEALEALAADPAAAEEAQTGKSVGGRPEYIFRFTYDAVQTSGADVSIDLPEGVAINSVTGLFVIDDVAGVLPVAGPDAGDRVVVEVEKNATASIELTVTGDITLGGGEGWITYTKAE